jgi:beta-N-acetylhexosaminidase
MGNVFMNLNELKQKWVEDSLKQMSTREKIGQMVCEHARKLNDIDDIDDFFKKYPVGGVYVGAEIIDPEADRGPEVRANMKRILEATSFPILMPGDFERGVGNEISGFTNFPQIMALGAARNPDLAYEYGKTTALEGRSLGAHMAFAPVVDLNINQDNPVVNNRAISDDPDIVIENGVAFIKGLQNNGLAATFKHFPGDGTDNRNQHLGTTVNRLNKAQWDKTFGKIYKAMIHDADAYSIMVGHIAFPAYEECGDDGLYIPATASKKILQELLRDELGFKGVIISDALSMAGYRGWRPYDERIIASVNAGVDFFLWPETEKFFALIEKALSDGRISETQINAAVHRILEMKAKLNLDQQTKELPAAITKRELAYNYRFACKVAEESITLLRNRANTLPLNLKKGAKVLVLSHLDAEHPKKFLQFFADKLSERNYNVEYKTSIEIYTSTGLGPKGYDAVFYLSNEDPRYGIYRSTKELWPVVADCECENRIFISFGNPYFLHDVANAETYINAYSDSFATQETTIKAIFGEIPFKGKVPVDCPFSFERGASLNLG